jgi:histidinol dehydrogenase
MKIIEFPEKGKWGELLQRPLAGGSSLEPSVRAILNTVKEKGDEALGDYSLQFDRVVPARLRVTESELAAAENAIDPALKAAIGQAKEHIERFHQAQWKREGVVEIMPGIICWRKSVGIQKVGLYIPGGTAPLFSTLLMLAIPARIARCKEIIVCSPPMQDGNLHPAILYTAQLLELPALFKVGGVQAIAAMAYGTASVPAVYKIFGPGNQYVACAKQLVQQDGIAVDLPAGPSELAVYADESAMADFVAADLLSQCEHGPDSQVLLVTLSRAMADQVLGEVNRQVAKLPRREMAEQALAHSLILIVADEAEALELLNAYAPEHLILACAEPGRLAMSVVNAGSVFLGHYAPESAGDYATGTNHTLPTNGFARAYSGVSVDSFVRKISFQQLSKEGLEAIAPSVIHMAMAEGLQAHAEAVSVRLNALKRSP